MSNIFVEDREGKSHSLVAEDGLTLMEIIRDAGLDIEAACGGCCSCATCHIYIEEKSLDLVSPINDDEESMLDQAFNVTSNSRLSCQIEYNSILEGIELTLAPE